MKKKGFTLVELLAVIVILAIIALITIPVVIKTINNSQEESEKQSIVGYARVIENDIANYLLDPKNKLADYEIPDNLDYKGNTVFCDKPDLSTNKLKLTNCYVSDKKLSDEEKANKNLYDYENGKVTKVSKSEESNNGSNSQQNNYPAYSVGDTISIHGDSYHVIVDSPTTQDYVVALKDEPLTYEEMTVNNYGQGYINKYTYDSVGQVYNFNGYGGMAYYSSPTCGNSTPGGSYSSSGCTTNYDNSDIKHVVDDWAITKFSNNELKEVDGYKARLATKEELQPIGWPSCSSNATGCSKETDTPSWIYNSSYFYWTMSQWNNSSSSVWDVRDGGYLYYYSVNNDGGAVRPVIHIYKSKI